MPVEVMTCIPLPSLGQKNQRRHAGEISEELAVVNGNNSHWGGDKLKGGAACLVHVVYEEVERTIFSHKRVGPANTPSKVHGDIQIFKNLNIFTFKMCALTIICKKLQYINQLNIDKIMHATDVNRNNDIFVLNTSQNL
jgi:hypothetical protein